MGLENFRYTENPEEKGLLGANDPERAMINDFHSSLTPDTYSTGSANYSATEDMRRQCNMKVTRDH